MARGGDSDITVDLEGEDPIDARAVADAINAIQELVGSVVDGEAPTLVLADLHMASVHITVRAPSDQLDILQDGLPRLRAHAQRPPGWHRDTLSAVVSLSRLTNLRGVESVQVQIDSLVERIDGDLQKNARQALLPQSVSLGSVRGVIYRYTNDSARSNRSAALRDSRTGDSVLLRFDNETAALVRQHLEAEVEVWGELQRDDEDAIIQLRVEGLELISPGDLSTVRDGRGILGSDWTGGVDPVDWVRSQRG